MLRTTAALLAALLLLAVPAAGVPAAGVPAAGVPAAGTPATAADEADRADDATPILRLLGWLDAAAATAWAIVVRSGEEGDTTVVPPPLDDSHLTIEPSG